MLVAEIHGKYVAEAREDEDYLTSTVFGHLRYLPPAHFWKPFLRSCRSLSSGKERAGALAYLEEQTGAEIDAYGRLQTIFWPTHAKGCPDLVLVFTHEGLRPIVVCIEAKLRSGKSGTDDRDQLARYLQACDSLEGFRPEIPANSASIVVYLTEHDSRNELLDSLKAYGDSFIARRRLYRVEWQDIQKAAEEAQASLEGVCEQIARDIAGFLRVRDLTHFRGMTPPPVDLMPFDGRLSAMAAILTIPDIPSGLTHICGGWGK
jgi:hypothetical protein